MGLWPAIAPTGYLNEKTGEASKCKVIIDQDRAPIIKKIFEKVAYEKWSGKKLFHWLKFDLNFRTATGHKHLSLGNIYFILQNTFYYGTFEYPRKGGVWYKGVHEPIITKELFDLAQGQVQRYAHNVESKEFAFTKIMVCGLCGSGITADEKFKKQKNGNVHRYAYYGCTKYIDKNCKGGYINEVDLIKQFEELMDTIDLDEIKIKEKLIIEVDRMKRFSSGLLGKREKIKIAEVDIRNYAKFVLREGSILEKRELLGDLKGKITLGDKQISLI